MGTANQGGGACDGDGPYGMTATGYQVKPCSTPVVCHQRQSHWHGQLFNDGGKFMG